MAATALVLLTAAVGSAQVGGAYIGFYPFYAPRGFYTNGFSMYGPPVPTYAPVPGMFGGSDQRLLNFWTPADWDRTRPRNYGPNDYVYPGTRPSNPGKPDAEPDLLPAPRPLPANAAAQFEVRLPSATAEVTFDGDPTRQNGSTRLFESPPLPRGQSFTYEVKANWRENGQEFTRSRSVTVQGGKRAVVDFTQPETGPQALK